MKVYHGTSYENFMNHILGNEYIKKNWSVSEVGVMYFYGSPNEKYNSDCLESAYKNAILCAAIQKSECNAVVVMELEVDQKWLSIDKSDGCENCYNLTRWSIKMSDLDEAIKMFTVHIYKYDPCRRWMYLYNLYHCTCGLSWDLAKDYVVDIDEVIEACDKWYEEHKDTEDFKYCYEYHFPHELPYMMELKEPVSPYPSLKIMGGIYKYFPESGKSNLPEEFKRVLMTAVKKSYTTLQEVQEGNLISDQKIFTPGINLLVVNCKNKDFVINKVKELIDLGRYDLTEYTQNNGIGMTNGISVQRGLEKRNKEEVWIIELKSEILHEFNSLFKAANDRNIICIILLTLSDYRSNIYKAGLINYISLPIAIRYVANSVILFDNIRFNDYKLIILKHKELARGSEVSWTQLL